MAVAATHVFLPGFGARAAAYTAGLPAGWTALQPPPPSGTDPLGGHVAWLAGELERRRGPALVAGHSMGAALAILLAALDPDAVAGLLLIAPAGLPLSKPIRGSAADFAHQLAAGRHRLRHTGAAAGELLAHLRPAVRLVRALRALDLSAEMGHVRAAGVPVTVVGCTTDTLTTPAHCAGAAALLGGRYRELDLDGGHAWMFGRWHAFASVLAQEARAPAPIVAG